MKFEWGDKNKKYAQHIYNIFNEWILSPPKKKERINEKGNIVNTQSFSKEEVEMMSKELNVKFNLSISLRLNKNKYVIVINSTSFQRFLDLTYQFIIPSMRYKLPKY